MKKILLLLFACTLFIVSCRKSISAETHDNGVEGDSTNFVIGDSITYEVITADPGGWLGIWADENGEITSTSFENDDWVYHPSGWRYSFKWNGKATQLMISAFVKSDFSKDITVNIYRNNELIKPLIKDQGLGASRLLYNIDGDTLQGTSTAPVLTYEVLIDQMDSTKNQFSAWNGDWFTKAGVNINDKNFLTEYLPLPSGWRYSFKPDHLPFTMRMQAWPFTTDGARVTLNFYVNGMLVKTASTRDLMYPPLEYEVQ